MAEEPDRRRMTLERDIVAWEKRALKAEAQRDQARQEVVEEVAAEFERRAKEQVKNEAEWVESKMAALTYEAAAAHCRGLATLDPSGEGNKGSEDCHRCGRGNTIWFAPSPLWNAVMRGGSIDGEPIFNDLVCATCFMQLAEESGVAGRFKVFAEEVNVELETATPSGRVWDEDRELWVDPCDVCMGTGLLSVEGLNGPTEVDCEDCNGTGKKPVPHPSGETTGVRCEGCDKEQRVGDEGWESRDALDWCLDCFEPHPSGEQGEEEWPEAKTHELKCWAPYFGEVLCGRKSFEVRREDDRHFEEGDLLKLRETDPHTDAYTGRECERRITYKFGFPTVNEAFGLRPDVVVLALASVRRSTPATEREALKLIAEAAPGDDPLACLNACISIAKKALA